MKYNSIAIAPVRSLEVGDLIAREFLGTVISGKITGIAHIVADLNEDQFDYLRENNLIIPVNMYDALGGQSSCLIFGEFRGNGINENQPSHMYVDYNVNVAIFPVKDRNAFKNSGCS